jgi:hypothetical protein
MLPDSVRPSSQVPFLEGGRILARAAAEVEIRKEVAAAYAEQLQMAGWFEALRLRREMKREIERRLEKIAPRHGLYLT